MKKCRIKDVSEGRTPSYIIHIIDSPEDKDYNIYLITRNRLIWGDKKKAIIFKSYKEAEFIIKHYCNKGTYELEDIK